MNNDLSDGTPHAQGGALILHKRQTIRGHALIMAVVFVFFLTLFGLAFYRFAETDVDLVASERNAMGALYAAQAGLEKTAWIIKHHPSIEQAGAFANLNPFSPAFYSENRFEDFQQVARNNLSGEGDYGAGILSPGGFELPRYFRMNRVDGRVVDEVDPRLMTSVRVQVLGALDVDGDGTAGLTDTDSEGFPIDPDDVNRKFEAMIGLPGSLAENLSAGSPVFFDNNGAVINNFPDNYGRLVTQDGYDLPGESGYFFWQRSDPLAGWDRFGYIFGRPMGHGPIKLPPGLFDDNGLPQLAYFSGLDPRQYEGNQTFDRLNDPTGGPGGRDIVFANGDVTIRNVDFGHLDNNGDLRGCDWQETDVAIIATGTLTARDIHCGNVGRLTLIAQNILLVGDYDTRINGIALASGTITLDDQETLADAHGCPNGVLKDETPAEPLRYTAYFMGTMLAGTSMTLKNGGWTVLFDEKVINGLMYDTTLSRPTLIYETAEGENVWYWGGSFGGELRVEKETYTPEEVDAGVAASWDLGGDDTPNVMSIYQQTSWQPSDDDHDYGVRDGVQLDFAYAPWNELQDWSNYRALTFWMSLDNYRTVYEDKETRRMSYFRVRLCDENWDHCLSVSLSSEDNLYDTTENPGNSVWRRVRIPFAKVIGHDSGFYIDRLRDISFWLYDFELSWYKDGTRQWIDFVPGGHSGYGRDGYFIFHLGNPDSYGVSEYPVRFWPESGKYKLYYTDAGGSPHGTTWDPNHDHVIQWNPDPSTTDMIDLYFEDQFNPNMRIDQIQLPGKPDSNAFLEYGLPRCFRYGVSHLREHQTF